SVVQIAQSVAGRLTHNVKCEIMITEKLRKIHKTHRLVNGDVSSHTKSAQRITKEWQEAIKSEMVYTEVSVSPENNEKIDVIDLSTKTAYELKVSGKNTHHEFYKDIAKVLTYNEYSDRKILKLIFLSEPEGIKSLKNRLDSKFVSLMKRKHNIEFELISI
ncbi:MAG: hypothetical protein L6290_00960, partial [Thermodesulfovibrionales bacterium]|nr:hypothetical protein [Thermodesulfovibrionales bacterium]